jgi:hypothetical protein
MIHSRLTCPPESLRRAALLFLIDAAIKSCDELCRLNAEGVAYFKESSESDRPARFDLLPVARRKSQRDHVFLSISLTFPEALYSSPESTKEFTFIKHD